MGERGAAVAGNDFLLLDGVALVAGAAVASVHLRALFIENLFASAWVIGLGTFLWVSVTAAGPFLFLLRRYARSLPGYPKVGDYLWAMLGLPWLVTALVQTPASKAAAGEPAGPLLAALLIVGLGLTSLVALTVVWTTWVVVTPEQASATFSAPWTNRVGFFLAIAWPVQCGLGMVVLS